MDPNEELELSFLRLVASLLVLLIMLYIIFEGMMFAARLAGS